MSETLVHVLQSHADNLPVKLAIAYLRDGDQLESELSYSDLDRRARAIAAVLQSRNLEGHRALLLYPAGVEFVCAFFGCLYAGVIAVPAPLPVPSRLKRTLPRLMSIIDDCDASIILTESRAQLDASVRESMKTRSDLEWMETDAIPDSDNERFSPCECSPNSLAYLQYTSGSISDPKGIEISHYNLWFQLDYLQKYCGYDSDSVTVTWMPNFHDWGLVEGLIEPIFNATPCYILSPIAFLKRPKNWLAAISRFRATHSQGPTFAYDHCLRRIPETGYEDLDLACWQSAGIAAEHVNYHVMDRFYQKFKTVGLKWSTFNPVFGLGEATLLVAVGEIGEPPAVLRLDPEYLENDVVRLTEQSAKNSRIVVSSGRAKGITRLAIVDPETIEELPNGSVGELWVRDPAVATGYWNRPEETEYTFRAQIGDSGPFLRTGDLGFMFDGNLYITGRLKDLIIVRGTNHYPQDIEWTAQNVHDGLTGQVGSAFSINDDGTEKLVLLHEVNRKIASSDELDSILSQIVVSVAEDHEIELFDLILLKRGAIPKTASGKIKRRASRESYLKGEFEPIARWSRSQKYLAESSTGFQPNGKPSTDSGRVDPLLAWLREYGATRINSLLMDERRAVPPHVILDFGNRGLFGLQVPKKYGGLELNFADTMQVLEQVAAIDVSLGTLVFLSNTNGLLPIIKYASEETKQALLPGLAAGRQLAAFALSEPSAGANIGAISTRATVVDDSTWSLSGTKRWNGSSWADIVTVIAREQNQDGRGQNVSAFIVQQGNKGVRVGEEALTMGLRGIVQNSLHLDQVPLGVDRLLGQSGDGWKIVNETLSLGRLCTAAVCLGGMKRALQLVYRYASVREISTGRLVEHPYVQDQLSSILSRIESIELVSNYMASQLDSGVDVSKVMLMVIKVGASEYFNQTTATAVQLLGGRGYMENNEVARLFRDARSLSIGEGPNESLIGFIGQPQNRKAVVNWLQSLEAMSILKAFQKSADEIKDRCERRTDLAESQRRFWAYHLTGTIAIEAAVLAVMEQVSEPRSCTTLWCRNRFERAIESAIESARTDPALRTLDQIHSDIDWVNATIGTVEQQLPGEERLVDPLLRSGRAPATVTPTDSGGRLNDVSDPSSPTKTDKKKRLLEELLKMKSATIKSKE